MLRVEPRRADAFTKTLRRFTGVGTVWNGHQVSFAKTNEIGNSTTMQLTLCL